jgi:Na+/H+-translocating membrane pyrophosphatase
VNVSDKFIFFVPIVIAMILAAYLFKSKHFIKFSKGLRACGCGLLSSFIAGIWTLIAFEFSFLDSNIERDFFSVLVVAMLAGVIGIVAFLSYFPKSESS